MKDYSITNIEERKKADSEFKKDFYKLMYNAVFGRSMEQVRNHRDIRLVTTDKERCQLVSEPNYHTTKRFFEGLGLGISKTLMYE